MDNQIGLSILSAVLDSMSYPNQIVSGGGQKISDATDVRDLHRYLMGGCYQTDQYALRRGVSTVQCGKLLSARLPPLSIALPSS
jgi:hypothetical protein